MEEYKAKFIDFLLKTGALKVFENPSDDRTLKSKRISSWFVNIGDFNDGASLGPLSDFYADVLLNSGVDFDMVYGIPEKGNLISPAIIVSLAKKGKNVPVFATRKVPKEHGEATNLSIADRIKGEIVGRVPKPGQVMAQIDDVFTAGDAKYEARTKLEEIEELVGGKFSYPILAIGVDRQEVGISASGTTAIEQYQEKTGTRVVSIVNAVDVYNILKERKSVSERALERLANYMRVYGTKDARTAIGRGLEQKIIGRDKSVIPACDVSTLEELEMIAENTADVEGIGGYKTGISLALRFGLPNVVKAIRNYTDKPIIHDNQKAGTDIPEMGKEYARLCKEAGVNAVILFPQSGPETERAWIYHALDNGLNVIVGGRMTHPAYAVSEGGFITDEGALDMYRIAARAGINNFVVPGNKPEVIKQVRDVVEAEGVSPVFYAPGFVAQGGKIEAAAKVAGDRFHGIVGRGIYQAKDMHAAAVEHTSQL